MITVYAYVLDTMADWELGFAASELNSGRFFKKDAQAVSFNTVGTTREPIKTMGGLTIIPDLSIEEIVDIGGLNAGDAAVLLLPGANSWNEPKHAAILEIARKFLQHGAIVCAICGATAALANAGLLNDRRHASNGQKPRNRGRNRSIAVGQAHYRTTGRIPRRHAGGMA